MTVKFKAIFGGANIHKDGDIRISFLVAQDEAVKSLALGTLTDTVFQLEIKPEEKDRN